MAFKTCTICGSGPVDADVPHTLPSPKGYEPMNFCDSCQLLVIGTSELRTNQGASDQTILQEIWIRYGLPAQKAQAG